MDGKTPILDLLYGHLVLQNENAAQALEGRMEEVARVRAILSSDAQSAVTLPFDIEALHRELPFFTPLIAGPRYRFISGELSYQALVTGGQSVVACDWSFSFDSNVAANVQKYLNHENNQPEDKQRVIALLKAKREHSLQIDWLPFIFENMRLSRENNRNARPLRTIAALKALEYLDWDAFYRDPQVPRLLTGRRWNDEQMLRQANETYEYFVDHPQVVQQESRALAMYALLLELAHAFLLERLRNRRRSPDTVKRIFVCLVDFCVLRLGKLPNMELSFILSFLENPKKLNFFGPLEDVAKKLPERLRGMAWDLTHLRCLETMASASRKGGGFFLPFFVAFDGKFSELIRHDPTTMVLIDEPGRSVLSARKNDCHYHQVLQQCMSEAVQSQMSVEAKQRRRNAKLDTEKLQDLIEVNESRVMSLVDQVRRGREDT